MTNQSSGKRPSIEIGRLKVSGHPAVLEALESKATRDEIQLDDSARYALGVGLSRPVGQDLRREGYTVLAEIGPPRQLKPENMTELAEDVAATIDKIRRLVGRTDDACAFLPCGTGLHGWDTPFSHSEPATGTLGRTLCRGSRPGYR